MTAADKKWEKLVEKRKRGDILVAPSILSANFGNLTDEIKRCERAGADMLHIDVMDGHFVPNLTIGPPVVRSIRGTTELFFDVHLMITSPAMFVEPFHMAGADLLTFHVESEENIDAAIEKCKKLGMKCGVSINPPTSVEDVFPFLEKVDMVLVMSVNPGFSGQRFMPEALPKIVKVREKLAEIGRGDVLIEVDGGIKDTNAHLVREAGADVLVSGSYLFGGDMPALIKKLREDSG